MNDILNKIENSIPENLKLDLKRRLNTSAPLILQLSTNLREMTNNNYEIRNILFSNNNDALYFSGDILATTLYNFWIKGGNIQDHFVERAQAASYTYGFKCLW